MRFLRYIPLGLLLSQPLWAMRINDRPDFWANVKYQVVGMAVVFIALGLLSLIISIIGKVFASLEGKPSASAPVSPAAAPTKSQTATKDAHTAVVIAAAVAAMLGSSYKIISISPRDTSEMAWGREGRREIWDSHRFRS